MRFGSISKVLCWPQVFCSVSSRIFNAFRRGFAVSVFIDFLNYKNKLRLLYTTKSGYTERGKTACEDIRTVELCRVSSLISFIAFVEFLIHVNKFRG
jgi:hypothetical protein